jgi:hypothetical protein
MRCTGTVEVNKSPHLEQRCFAQVRRHREETSKLEYSEEFTKCIQERKK